MPQGSDITTYLSQKTTDKECKNNLPTFIDGRKHLFQPQKVKLNTIRFTQKCTAPAPEIFTVDYTYKDQATA